MNTHMYIPGLSAHPLLVKRAFVKAELTRFAIICAEEPGFLKSVDHFFAHLKRRGNPLETLNTCKKQVNYRNRRTFLSVIAGEIKNDCIPLMLPSKYNDVWKYIKMQDICDAIMPHWNILELPNTVSGPLIKSLQKLLTSLTSSRLEQRSSQQRIPPYRERPDRQYFLYVTTSYSSTIICKRCNTSYMKHTDIT